MKTRVKICCIGNRSEAQDAISMGASALGLVGHMPSGPGIITDKDISDIAQFVPPAVSTFLLTSETTAAGIVNHHQRVHTTTVQIVDSVDLEVYPIIRKASPGLKIVQVIHIIDEHSVEEALSCAPQVDALLFDSGNPALKVKELGGTGRTHNWELSRKIVEQTKTPVFLAGGLNPNNVQAAIEMVQPFGVDLCSGVRTNGNLDLFKLEKFFSAINT